ncbi:hypothetical protein ACFSRY_02975 [Pontibacter locisalis]|uniref:Uncharacterized protein n=1 Tax=Pontibacter locisalis TaxID=1719035 RepID=A0ABW5IGN7_9BACT
MKQTWKLAFAAFALFAFTACGNEDNSVTESENIETTDELETEMEIETEVQEDTVMVEDNTVEDGVADEIEEEQPPIE